MLGKIQKIEEIIDFNVGHYATMDGYQVTTDKHIIRVLISNEQDCCESWGYFSSDDNLPYFIGAELLEVKLTDIALNQQAVEDSGYYEDAGGIQFVDFVTNNGTFQLAVYNAHNGYYGHNILVTKEESKAEILCNDCL